MELPNLRIKNNSRNDRAHIAKRRKNCAGRPIVRKMQKKTMTAKTTTERVTAMRAARDAAGLKRLELYAHPDDWPAIKELAEKLQRKRAKPVKSKAA